MDIKDLNKTQLIMLAILLSFIVSIATGITTVTLMEQAPSSITVPINRIVKQTVEKVVPAENDANFQTLSDDQKQLLEDLKAIKPLTVSLYLKGSAGVSEDKILGTGLFLGNDKIVIASVIASPSQGQTYVVKSVLGEQKVSSVSAQKDFTIIELAKTETTNDNTPKDDTSTTPAPTPTTTQ